MSKLETNTIDNISGSSTLTIGDSNTSTIALKSGATLTNFPDNTPAFEANTPSAQDSTHNVAAKINFTNKVFDTNSNYSTTNKRFTPTVAGKYYVYSHCILGSTQNHQIDSAFLYIYKNGSEYRRQIFQLLEQDEATNVSLSISAAVDMNGSSDYVEIYFKVDAATGANQRVENDDCIFGAYKIIGA